MAHPAGEIREPREGLGRGLGEQSFSGSFSPTRRILKASVIRAPGAAPMANQEIREMPPRRIRTRAANTEEWRAFISWSKRRVPRRFRKGRGVLSPIRVRMPRTRGQSTRVLRKRRGHPRIARRIADENKSVASKIIAATRPAASENCDLRAQAAAPSMTPAAASVINRLMAADVSSDMSPEIIHVRATNAESSKG